MNNAHCLAITKELLITLNPLGVKTFIFELQYVPFCNVTAGKFILFVPADVPSVSNN
jgi:hypothetical protein